MMDGWRLVAIIGLACATVVSRSFFFLSGRRWPLPSWAERGLQYAPIAALSAVVVPEIVMAGGELVHDLQDARLFGAAAATAVYFWRRDALLTIVVGMAVYLPLYIGLGWH